MGYSKQIGPLSISESGGIATISVSASASVGGGSVAGVVQASVSASAQVSGVELVNAGLAIAASKFPSLASEIAALQGLIDAEIAKL
jgi:hypothetical protein